MEESRNDGTEERRNEGTHHAVGDVDAVREDKRDDIVVHVLAASGVTLEHGEKVVAGDRRRCVLHKPAAKYIP